MQSEKVNAVDSAAVTVAANAAQHETASATGVYTVECFDADGNLKWSEQIKNLVVTVGKNYLLDTFFAGSSYTAAWYLGLINSGGTYNAADTMASHGGWTENTGYSASTRPAASFGTASGGTISTTATAFAINATSTIGGAFLTNNNTKGGTTGILYSAGNFTGGNRSVVSGDTLNVTYSASV
jgi:hypothetical protein